MPAPPSIGQADLPGALRLPTGPQNLFAPEAFRRLQAVKAAYDPDGLLRGNHDVVAAR